MRRFDDINSDVLRVAAMRSQTRDRWPVTRRDSMTRPIAHGAALRADLSRNPRRPSKGTDDLRGTHSASLPDSLATRKHSVARPYGAGYASIPGIMRAMAKKKLPSVLKLRIARRLEAVRAEFGLSQEPMAQKIGATRSAWSNWISTSSPEMPAEEAMIRLCREAREWGLTLDWLYRGITDNVNTKAAIRLAARVHGLDPDSAGASVLELVDDRI